MELKKVKPKCVFSEKELQKLLPSFKIEMMKSEKEVVKDILKSTFYRLGGDLQHGFEIVTDGLYKNKFGEVDDSPRVVMSERVDEQWCRSGFASDWAKVYTSDTSLLVTMGKLRTGGEG